MTGLVFTAPTDCAPATPAIPAPAAPATVTIPPPADSELAKDSVLPGGGWYPDVDLALMRAAMRFDGTVTAVRLSEAALGAMISVNNDLAKWQSVKARAGATSLAAVSADQIGGQNRLEILYRRAVFETTKADLDEAYRDFSATAGGELRADGLTPTIGDHRRNARWAIRDIQGQSRSSVELI